MSEEQIYANNRKRWTHDEDLLLSEMWGQYSLQSISDKLNRSINAIMNRKNRLGLGSFYEGSDYITINQLYKTLKRKNAGQYYIQSWIKKRKLPMFRKQRGKGVFVRCIRIEDFWKWADNNRTVIDFSKLKRNSLGAEPEWVETQRRIDEREKVRITQSPWTKADDEKLIAMLKQFRYNTSEIGERLCRTEGAVMKRIYTLGIKYRPLQRDNHIKWYEEEIQLLNELICRGEKYSGIASTIERHSQKAIRGMVYRLYHTENLDKVRITIKEENR